MGTGVELMNTFIDNTGAFKHWDGRVRNEDYETSKGRLLIMTRRIEAL
jgi:hypothetical protein